MNCIYSVLPGILEVIILIALVNSGGTDSPAHKSSSTFWNCAIDIEIHWIFFYLILLKLIRINQKGWQFSCHLITGRNVTDLSPENVYLILF